MPNGSKGAGEACFVVVFFRYAGSISLGFLIFSDTADGMPLFGVPLPLADKTYRECFIYVSTSAGKHIHLSLFA